MKKKYIQPYVKEIKVSTNRMFATSPNGPIDEVTNADQLGKEDLGDDFGW